MNNVKILFICGMFVFAACSKGNASVMMVNGDDNMSDKVISNNENMKSENSSSDKKIISDESEVVDYDSCVKAGGLILKTFPPKCKDPKTGKVYVKNI